ncbi:SRPBCC family protein [Kutzneria buriramensis]|uniref:Carbon monoxide dehydrogenase subunit G n=1 Tax=Kutzneria buriramensis TaxID=1045776 RepID=A0A3E0HVT0_9PSEU|nr:SRPBCC family protein [Kutzneria buriramensis]REH50380.1 carbon monoxide dehydrogenase subunit G [Kutzneria buriramensis]
MRLEHQFRVAAPIGEVWSALRDPQRVAPCMPGATLTSAEGESFAGTVKVKLGPVALLYKGSGSFDSIDDAAHRAVITASGKDSRGNGTASATVEVTLSADDGGGTAAAVVTELAVTGRPAQFGRGLISEVGGKILDQFAACLADKLAPPVESVEQATAVAPPQAEEPAADQPPAAPPKAAGPPVQPQPEAEPLDLMEFAGRSVAKRAVFAIGAAVLLIVLISRLRRR